MIILNKDKAWPRKAICVPSQAFGLTEDPELVREYGLDLVDLLGDAGPVVALALLQQLPEQRQHSLKSMNSLNTGHLEIKYLSACLAHQQDDFIFHTSSMHGYTVVQVDPDYESC